MRGSYAWCTYPRRLTAHDMRGTALNVALMLAYKTWPSPHCTRGRIHTLILAASANGMQTLALHSALSARTLARR